MFNALCRSFGLKLGGLVLLFLVFAVLVNAYPAFAQDSAPPLNWNPQDLLRNTLIWIESLGTGGAIAFMGLYIVATVVLVPSSILTVGAGAVYGVVLGSLYVFLGATLGAIAAFLVGRYLARGWVIRKIAGNAKFKAIDQAVGKEGFKIVLLTRLSPVFPFIFLNYAYGVTGVSLKDYAIASVGMIPGTILYVYIGSLVGNIALLGSQTPTANPIAQWAIRIIGLIATVAVTLYVTKIARKALNESVLVGEKD